MKIFVVAGNYPIHNNNTEQALLKQGEPVVFLKSDSSLLKAHKPFFVPTFMGKIDYGCHLAVRICRLGKTISSRFAHRYYDALTVGVDFTASDMLAECRQKGLPWDVAKGFDGAAVIGDWVPKEKFLNVQAVHFGLCVNETSTQSGCTSDMLTCIDDEIAHISRFYTLKTGDILFTGAPSADCQIHIEEHVTGFLEDRKVLDFRCK